MDSPNHNQNTTAPRVASEIAKERDGIVRGTICAFFFGAPGLLGHLNNNINQD